MQQQFWIRWFRDNRSVSLDIYIYFFLSTIIQLYLNLLSCSQQAWWKNNVEFLVFSQSLANVPICCSIDVPVILQEDKVLGPPSLCHRFPELHLHNLELYSPSWKKAQRRNTLSAEWFKRNFNFFCDIPLRTHFVQAFGVLNTRG